MTSLLSNFKVLGSSSAGNGYLYGTLLVDCGLSAKNIDTDIITACIITHFHGDHIKIPTYRKLMKAGIPIYVPKRYKRFRSRSEIAKLSKEEREYATYIDVGEEVVIDNGFEVIKFHQIAEVPHDVPNHAYHIELDDWKIFHVTDAGDLDDVDLKGVEYDHMTIEFNHCEVFIGKEIQKAKIKGNYCRYERSAKTHLSVQQAMEFYLENKGEKTTLFKAHKSEGAYTMSNYYRILKKMKRGN